MATIVPHSMLVQKALEHILSSFANTSQKDLVALVDEAAMRFNLSPLEVESLMRILQHAKETERS